MVEEISHLKEKMKQIESMCRREEAQQIRKNVDGNAMKNIIWYKRHNCLGKFPGVDYEIYQNKSEHGFMKMILKEMIYNPLLQLDRDKNT